jgi:amino acid permease
MLVSKIYTALAQVIPSVAPVAPVDDPRSTVELLIQAVGAVVMLVGLTIITRQIIYKQFGRETYAAAEFRKGMLRGALWLMLGIGIMAAAIVLSPRLR